MTAMISAELKVEGLKELQALFGSFAEPLGDEIRDIVAAKTPHAPPEFANSGAASRAWESIWDGKVLTVGNPLDYPFFLEVGTVKMQPFGMMSSTLPEIPDMITKYLDK